MEKWWKSSLVEPVFNLGEKKIDIGEKNSDFSDFGDRRRPLRDRQGIAPTLLDRVLST